MEGWHELYQVAAQPFGFATAISAVTFDTSQELLWTGDVNGRIASLAGSSLRKYTSYVGHKSAVQQILVNDRGVLSLDSDTLRMTQRRGILRFNLKDETKMKDLTCMSYTSRGTSEVVVAGQGPGLFRINVDRGSMVNEVPSDDGFTVLRRGGRLICGGSTRGEVVLIDPVSLQIVRKIPAHSGGLADLDTHDNVLLTCGQTHRGTSYLLDPLLNIYDLRTFRPQAPVPFPAGAAYVRMHPKMSTTCLVSSVTGQLQMLDFFNPAHAYLYQANINYVTGLEFSTSGDYFALAGNPGSVQIWGTSESSQFTEFGRQIEWNDPIMDTSPSIKLTDDVPLSTVGMPYYREKLLSAWPSDMVFNVARPPEPIDPEILATMKMVDFVGYAPFPKRHRRYVTESLPYSNYSKAESKTPMFRSEQDKILTQNGTSRTMEATTDPVESFKKVEIKYSKFGVEDFDFGFYNRTPYAGLETHLQNSYTNALLQLYRFTPLVYNFALKHVSGSCRSESCLLCELGFLFDMLSKAEGQHCRAYNFVRTLSSIPQASALGLLDDEASTNKQLPLGAMLQSFNRFLMERIGQENRSKEIESSELINNNFVTQLDKVAGVTTLTTVCCGNCNSETHRRATTYVTDLLYPKLHDSSSGRGTAVGSDNKSHSTNFCNILRQSLESKTHTRGWCGEKCRRYQMLTTTKRVQSLAPVLVLNAAINTPASRQLWNQKNFLPMKFEADIGKDGLMIKQVPESTPAPLEGNGSEIYELAGMVVEVNFGPADNHMVSLIRIPHEDGSKHWYLFNDFSVRQFPASEALKFDYVWKTPTSLIYQSCRPSCAEYSTQWKDQMDTSLLYSEAAINFDESLRFEYSCLTKQEAPQAGTLVAIDAEFVALQQEETEIRSDGTRHLIRPSRLSLARVSVVRGDGPKAGAAFIDDYIATKDNIVDYLTEFSGIEIGDLDPLKSKKSLVPLKVAYKKLWVLLNLGCVFVGHGLANDFRTINIQVPKDQVIDTVDLYYIKSRQRKLSLRFLAWYLLNENIQMETHDSIEDAKTALFLYNKYLEINEQGGPSAFENVLNEIYNEGRVVNFRPPVVSLSDTTKSTSTTNTPAMLTKEVPGMNAEDKKVISQLVEL
ncbi:ubiquitin carboxyl-terminal hydrolase-domain-containing protein [Lipomyces doorenjongii]|uniref:ubiquitin carboxyl-terminal hydrolase-domain-containing protein n=1 Tax=Lipomyces doorenjongii TaxID=383834 RepID=UPI0034CFA0DF